MSSPSLSLLESSVSQLVKQGAEAKIYKSVLHPIPSSPSSTFAAAEPVLLKHRFKKNYRHPSLNSILTKARVAGEARALMRCLRSGVHVPGIRMVDASEGVIGIQWIDGKSVRALLGSDDESDTPSDDAEDLSSQESPEDHLAEFGLDQTDLMRMIGTEIAKMHDVDIIHGDLTTSNMMVRLRPRRQSRPDGADAASEVVLIDFGLSFISALAEDKAVDLYVLERAFASTHPDSEPLFDTVLKEYAAKSGMNWKPVRRKLDEVRLRGRKRSMVG